MDVVTPEGVALELHLVGLGSRAIATVLDTLVQLTMLLAVSIALALIRPGEAVTLIVLALSTFSILYLYYVLFEAYAGGRTPGKRWSSIRVLCDDGRPIGIGESAVRNIVRLVDWLPLFYGVGAVSIMATKRNQRLGDLAAHTIVVREPRKVAVAATGIERPPGVLPAWDVAAIGADDMAAARTFLARRETLAAGARTELANRLAGGLAAKIPGVAPPVDPERFLETLVALKASR
jgi:uncharacterized RDD family membrane protein YckC